MSPEHSPVVCDGYVKYAEAEVDRLAIMQDNRMRKNDLKWPPVGQFGFYFCKICQGLSLCDTLHLVLYSWSTYLALYSIYVNITK